MHSIKANRNNKGIILIFTLLVMVIMLGVTGAMVIRAIDASRTAQRSSASLQAFYEAESGLAYAYAEESQAGFNFYTHKDKDNDDPVTGAEVVTKGAIAIAFDLPEPTALDAFIEDSGEDTNFYKVAGRNFKVKAYPEEDGDGDFTGVIVLHSQATVNGVTRTLEYRLGQVSAYQYFFFYPSDMSFENVTFDGRNYGAIHVNGNIFLRGYTNFYYLTALTCSYTDNSKGYFIRPQNYYYPQLGSSGTLEERNYNSTVSYPWQLDWCMYIYSPSHFAWGDTVFKFGPLGTNTSLTLNSYLDATDPGMPADVAWDYKKYDGNRTVPVHYRITDDALKNLAAFELAGRRHANDYYNLLDPSKHIVVLGIDFGSETDVFKGLYDGDPAMGGVLWNIFWNKWKNNHGNDFQTLRGAGAPLIGGEDWERKFLIAAYHWDDMWVGGDGMPNAINREWWEDLVYGNGDPGLTVPAKVEDYYTGVKMNQYILNTSKQKNAFHKWVKSRGLDKAGDDKTLVGDNGHGGKYINPGRVIGSNMDNNIIKEKAKNGGIYIGEDDSFVGLSTLGDAAAQKKFFNALRPAVIGNRYAPSNILQIDVKKLKEKIDADKASEPQGPLANFNGVVYVELTGYTWPAGHINYPNADGVMLVQGARLPDGGLSLGTPNNVFIKGDYNLDPTGVDRDSDGTKEREPDPATVRARYPTISLEWQPAEVITQRQVYTLSNNFAEPQTMPLIHHQYYQYYDQASSYTEAYINNNPRGYADAQIIGHPRYGTSGASWLPVPTDSYRWFEYTSTALPAAWNPAWIDATWGGFDWSDPTMYSYNTHDADPGNDAYILRGDLKIDIYNKVYDAYNNEYAYNASRASNAYQRSNAVGGQQIYNTAIVAPARPDGSNTTDPLVLEYWGGNSRIVTGAFIQLPKQLDNGTQVYLNVPNESYCAWGRYNNPDKTFKYETRYGRDSDQEDRPRVGLIFGADSSWREVKNASF